MRFNFKRLSNASCIRFARIVACEFCSSNRMTAARLFSPSFLFARHPIARPDQVSLLTYRHEALEESLLHDVAVALCSPFQSFPFHLL